MITQPRLELVRYMVAQSLNPGLKWHLLQAGASKRGNTLKIVRVK